MENWKLLLPQGELEIKLPGRVLLQLYYWPEVESLCPNGWCK